MEKIQNYLKLDLPCLYHFDQNRWSFRVIFGDNYVSEQNQPYEATTATYNTLLVIDNDDEELRGNVVLLHNHKLFFNWGNSKTNVRDNIYMRCHVSNETSYIHRFNCFARHETWLLFRLCWRVTTKTPTIIEC